MTDQPDEMVCGLGVFAQKQIHRFAVNQRFAGKTELEATKLVQEYVDQIRLGLLVSVTYNTTRTIVAIAEAL